MPRFIILGVVLAIAFTLFSLVDAAMTEQRRVRGVPKPVWVLICVLLPVIGGILWLTVGKGDGTTPVATPRPDDDPRFGAMSSEHVDERIKDLEAQLRALDEEVFPGETPEHATGEGAQGGTEEPEPPTPNPNSTKNSDADDTENQDS